jgi:hypothetical protein
MIVSPSSGLVADIGDLGAKELRALTVEASGARP